MARMGREPGGPVVKSDHRSMWALNESITELAIWLAVLVVLTVVAVYVIVRVRTRVLEKEASRLELLSKFREVHLQGGLSDAEFRTIKTRLADRGLGELKGKDETG